MVIWSFWPLFYVYHFEFGQVWSTPLASRAASYHSVVVQQASVCLRLNSQYTPSSFFFYQINYHFDPWILLAIWFIRFQIYWFIFWYFICQNISDLRKILKWLTMKINFFFIPHQIKHALSCEINIFKKIMLKLKTKFWIKPIIFHSKSPQILTKEYKNIYFILKKRGLFYLSSWI